MKASRSFNAVVLLLASLVGALQVTAQEAPAPLLDWGVKIPMRDGVRLNATVYKPADMTEPVPVIFTLTPYISDSYHDRAMYFAQHGYAFALVDVRGRGSSEGEFEPFANDPGDGHDIVEWLAMQPWSNGKTAMWGGSYAGFNQWATLKEGPPHLSTIVPAAAAHAAVDFPFFQNIFYPYDMQWLTLTSGVTPNSRLFGEDSFWIDKFTELYNGHLPFNVLDSVVGNLSTVFQKWLAHPTPDAYWDATVPNEEQYRNMSIPILTITGHYDGDQLGAMEFYRRHMRYGNEAGRASHYLIMGPWDHAGTRTPRREVGGLTFGEASMLDLNDLHRQWYDWTMKEGAKPEFLEDRVAYYVVGAEEWKYAPTLEAISNETIRLYLGSEGNGASGAFSSGTLTWERPTSSSPDVYTYDPLNTRPGKLQQNPVDNSLTDQTAVLSIEGDGLVYHTAPFTEATEVSGFLRLALWIEIDVPDTDFAVSVYEIMQDGKSVLLTFDRKRARYRESLREAKLVTPGQPYEYVFDSFQFFSRRIAEGSRLRLVVTSPNSIHAQKNYNSGGVVAEESGRDAKTATVRVYHDGERVSFLEIPVKSSEK